MEKFSFDELRNKYKSFVYKNFEVKDESDKYVLKFYFEIPGLESFNPSIEIEKKDFKNTDKKTIENIAFNIGLVELISYWKCACPKNVFIDCGYIDNFQIKWFKKNYYNGLGEFFYINNIDVSIDEFMEITCRSDKNFEFNKNYTPSGNLIPIGGGKDSVVTLETLKKSEFNNEAIIINPKDPSVKCAEVSGNNYYTVKRTIDKKLIELNSAGYLNGHTPFSVVVAFISYLVSYLSNNEYIVLSNEGSANEPTVIGTNINHQYSKTIDFENDFRNYVKLYFDGRIKYFSLLRCLNELQIAREFTKHKEYFKIFKSCNVGSKSLPWKWCCNCSKCLFVFIMMYAFLDNEAIIEIFGENLYEKEDLKPIFIELLGCSDAKPFECVGTISEVRLAVNMAVEKEKELPYLLKYYKENFNFEKDESLINEFNNIHNIEDKFLKIIKENLK